jgi:FMN-dependent NADH-azoreductase
MNILHIDCSPRAGSHNRQLSAPSSNESLPSAAVRASRAETSFEPIPHAEPDYAAVLSSPAALAAGSWGDAMRLSVQLIKEVDTADVSVSSARR